MKQVFTLKKMKVEKFRLVMDQLHELARGTDRMRASVGLGPWTVEKEIELNDKELHE